MLNATTKRNINFSEEYPLNSNHRKNKIEFLKTMINNQINFSFFSKESNITTEPSFVIAWNIARVKHPYTDGELALIYISTPLFLFLIMIENFILIKNRIKT